MAPSSNLAQAAGSYQVKIKPLIVILFVVIKPHFCNPDRVLPKNVGPGAPSVWAAGSKDVSNVRAHYLL